MIDVKPTLLKCSICARDIEPELLSGWTGGHNAMPVNDGRCCRDCNDRYVIPRRIVSIFSKRKEEENG